MADVYFLAVMVIAVFIILVIIGRKLLGIYRERKFNALISIQRTGNQADRGDGYVKNPGDGGKVLGERIKSPVYTADVGEGFIAEPLRTISGTALNGVEDENYLHPPTNVEERYSEVEEIPDTVEEDQYNIGTDYDNIAVKYLNIEKKYDNIEEKNESIEKESRDIVVSQYDEEETFSSDIVQYDAEETNSCFEDIYSDTAEISAESKPPVVSIDEYLDGFISLTSQEQNVEETLYEDTEATQPGPENVPAPGVQECGPTYL